MAYVQNYLDCGCTMMDDGSRVWCPSCTQPRRHFEKPAAVPVDLILHCPNCGTQHIDAPDDRTPGWTNPPHRSHLCHACGHIWRPADVPTNGVAAITTSSVNDSPRVDPARRITDLLNANAREVERRRDAEHVAEALRDRLMFIPTPGVPRP